MQKKPIKMKAVDSEIVSTTARIFSPEYKKILDGMIKDVVEAGYAEEYVNLVGEIEKKIRKKRNMLCIVSLSFVLSQLMTNKDAQNMMTYLRECNDISVQ
jgi:hypothetical protein